MVQYNKLDVSHGHHGEKINLSRHKECMLYDSIYKTLRAGGGDLDRSWDKCALAHPKRAPGSCWVLDISALISRLRTCSHM